MDNFYGSWSVLTTNFLFVLYLALNGVTLASILHLANGKWRFHVRKMAVATASLFPLAFVLLIIILANGETTFVWMAEQAAAGHGGAHGEGQHLPGWHDYNFLVIRQILGFFIMAGLYTLFIKYQHESDIDSSYRAQRRFRNIALLIPFFYVTYGTMVAWDFEMTQVAGWHSASYGFYHFQSNFHMYLAFMTVLVFFMNKSGRLVKEIPPYVYNYFAQFMLGMTILWTYLYFTQYLIMWYGRLPTDMDRYDSMMLEGFGPIWWTFLALKFIIPFCTLAITPNRHNPPVIVAVACSILLGTWLERYTWIAGSADSSTYHMPMTHIFDIGVTVLVAGIAWAIVRWTFRRYGITKASS
jgi:hypothetical protein